MPVKTRPLRIELIDDPRYLAGIFGEIRLSVERANFAHLWRQDAIPMLRVEHQNYFAQAAGPLGGWAPLAASTIARKGHAKILIETDAMRKSLVGRGQNHVEEIFDFGFSWGTADEKAMFHQLGTSRMPARPFVGTTVATVDNIARLCASQTVEYMKG